MTMALNQILLLTYLNGQRILAKYHIANGANVSRDNEMSRYGHFSFFKMAAVRHLEFP